MIGHSIGEYVAACLAGVFSLEDALALVAARGRLMQAHAGRRDARRAARREASAPLLGAGAVAGRGQRARRSASLSGPSRRIERLCERASRRAGVTARRLQTSHAFHSAMMDPVARRVRAEVAAVERHGAARCRSSRT